MQRFHTIDDYPATPLEIAQWAFELEPIGQQVMAKLSMLHASPPPKWSVDESKYSDICAELGVITPPRVRALDRGDFFGGCALGGVLHNRVTGEQTIAMAPWFTPVEASSILWHELTHIRQEQGVPFEESMLKLRREWEVVCAPDEIMSAEKYILMPSEAEAYQVQHDNHKRIQACV